jgi:hypothetical protein
MTTTANPAAGDGLLTRRRLLEGAGTATLAAGAVVVPLAADALPTADVVAENPKLLELGAKLPAVEKTYRDARRARWTTWKTWSPQWPLAPEPCTTPRHCGYGEMERDLSGTGLTRDGETYPRGIRTAEDMGRSLEEERKLLAQDDKRKRSYGREWRRYRVEHIAQAEAGLALLPGYLAECERIRKESNYEAVDAARRRSAEELVAFVRRVLVEPSRTMAGVTIKAQACAVLGRMPAYDRMCYLMGDTTGKDGDPIAALLANAVLDVLGATG